MSIHSNSRRRPRATSRPCMKPSLGRAYERHAGDASAGPQKADGITAPRKSTGLCQNLPPRDADDQTACAYCVRQPTGSQAHVRCTAISFARFVVRIGTIRQERPHRRSPAARALRGGNGKASSLVSCSTDQPTISSIAASRRLSELASRPRIWASAVSSSV